MLVPAFHWPIPDCLLLWLVVYLTVPIPDFAGEVLLVNVYVLLFPVGVVR